MADDPVESTLGPGFVDPRLPPVSRQRRERERGGNRRRGRNRDSRALRLDPERARRELAAEVDRGNALLAKSEHKLLLELLPGAAGAPDRVAICYPPEGATGARCVVRTVRRRDLQRWLTRLEQLEGLVIDTER